MRALLPLAIVALLPLALAEECYPSTSDPTLTLPNEAALGVRYIVSDMCQPECLFSIWLYFEDNGFEGLQRGDEVHDDTCGGAIWADSFVW